MFMPDITINSTRIHYEERGQGTPIVLIHGFPLDSRMWEAQLEALSDQYRVIAPDLPGFGQSAAGGPFSMNSLSDGLHAFLEKLNALPCVLGGLSMGGYICFAHITRYPTDVRALLLIDTKAEADTSEGRKGRMQMIELAKSSGSRAVADQMMPKMIAASTVQNSPQCLHRLREIMESVLPQTIEYAQLAMCERADYRAELPSIAVPTLIIVGDQDAFAPPRGAAEMNRQIPHSHLAVIRNAGHMAPMEQPEDVNSAIRGFLKTLP